MQRIILLLIIGLLSSKAYSQERQPFFYKIFADDGLTSDKTTKVIQDHEGYVWAGTEEGLNRIIAFDQYETYKFDRNDSNSLSDDHITALYVDSRKRLWVGTRNGLNLYNRTSDSFQRISTHHVDGHSQGIRVNDIIEDENRDLWVICHDHLVKFNGNALEQQEVVHLEDRSLNLLRLVLFESRLRLGTSNGVYTLVDGTFQKSSMAQDLPVTDLLPIDNELWIATASSGVWRYDAINGETRVYDNQSEQGQLRSNHVNDLALIDDGEVWVSSIRGVTVIDRETEETKHYYHDFDNGFSISDRVVRQVYQDRAGNVWLTTPNSGINYYHEADKLFSYYGQSEEDGTPRDLMDYGILSMYSEGERAWLGSRKGLSLFHQGVFEHYPLTGSHAIWLSGIYAIQKEANGKFWLGTDYKLMNWDPVTKKYSAYNHERLNGSKINTLAIDQEQKLWIGTEDHGLKVLNQRKPKEAQVTEVVAPVNGSWSSIQAILHTPKGTLVGTGLGLYSIIDEEINKVPLSVFNDGLSDDLSINTLSLDQAGNIMVGTKHDGLIILSAAFKPSNQIGKEHGLVSPDIRAIIEEKEGVLWLSTNAGLSRVMLKENEVTKITNYDVQDGLQSNHFSVRSAAQLSNGKIFMGGLSGLTFFYPEDIHNYDLEQSLNFISLFINGEKAKVGEEGSPLKTSIASIDQVVLNPEQNHFTIEFSALDHVRPTDVVYRYKMSGVNEDWIVLKNTNKATFQNLSGGKKYTFLVQSKAVSYTHLTLPTNREV